MTEDNELAGGDAFSPEETAYFESRGASPAPEPKPEVQEAAEPETNPSEALKEAVEEGERQKQVPHQALHEERKRRKDAEERARNLELENAKATARLEALLEANKPKEEAPQPAEPPKRPRADEDVFGTSDAAYEKAETAHERLDRLEAERKEAEELRSLAETVQEKVESFLQETPDYPDALDFMRNARAREIKRWSPQATNQQIAKAIAREEAQFVKNALQRGLDPVRMAYETATDRGYQKKAPAPAADPGESDAVKKLEQVEKGQAASKSLSSAGGGAPSGGVTAQDLLAMSDAEFLAYTTDAKTAQKARRLMGHK